MSRKGRTEGDGWVHLKGETSMAITWLAVETPWLALGGPLYLQNGLSLLTTIPGKEIIFFQSVKVVIYRKP